MNQDKPQAASLTAALLARKGEARPAIKPGLNSQDAVYLRSGGIREIARPIQPAAPAQRVPDRLFTSAPAVEAEPETQSEKGPEIVQIAASPLLKKPERPLEPPSSEFPRETLRETIPASAPLFVPEPVARRAAGSKPKAAFTLRLDAERHLRLRLLSAHAHRSSQQLLIEALDRLLAERLAEVPEALAKACACLPSQGQ
jgi:hypothetical protein